jgi:hypothetical protein
MNNRILRLHQCLILQSTRPAQGWYLFWLVLSLLFALWCSSMALQEAFHQSYVIQDDALQHVFWMRRFLNPTVFPDDPIADYFQAIAPSGYTWLYRSLTSLSIDPVWLSKVLPVGLTVITTGYCFVLCLELLPMPAAGFGASLLLNQIIWVNDDVVSGTPRAFVYPLLTAFLFYLVRRSLLPCLVTIVLQGLFYPQTVLLSAGLLTAQMVDWRRGWPTLSRQSADYRFCCIGIGVAIAIMLPYALSTSDYGPVATWNDALTMPEFQPGGRAAFFSDDGSWQFWVKGGRSGLLPRYDRLPIVLYAAIALPLMLWCPRWFPLTRHLKPSMRLLWDLIVVSLAWYGIAYAVLYRLHLPSRYTQHTFRVGLALATAIALLIAIDALLHWAEVAHGKHRWRNGVALVCSAAIALVLLLFPLFGQFPRTGYIEGDYPDLYVFFAQQPADTVIASIADEASNIPSFSVRSVVTAREFGIPYHLGYYRQFVQRTTDVITAQYSPDLDTLRTVTNTYNIDFWLLDRTAFETPYLRRSWVNQYPDVTRPIQRSLRQGRIPMLQAVRFPCAVFENADLLVVDAACAVEHGQDFIEP